MPVFLRHDWIDGLSVDVFKDKDLFEIRSYGAIHNLSGSSKTLSAEKQHSEPTEEFRLKLKEWRNSYDQ